MTPPDEARDALYEALPTTEAEWRPFWHRVDEPDGWVVSIYGGKLAEYTLQRLAASGWVVVPRDVLEQALDRMQSTFDLMHPGDQTDDELHGMAQHMWFGIEELHAAMGEPSWYDPAALATEPDRETTP